jgi:pSer/pThr/pTyr-binding forkhead associated (FHA) protein
MKASVVIRGSFGTHYEVRLGRTCTIGRSSSQTIQLCDALASRRHAAIAWVDNYFWLQDRSSQNGTYLNDSRIIGPTRLCVGDVICIGETTLLFSDGCQVHKRFFEDEDSEHFRDSDQPVDRLSRIELPSHFDESNSGSINEDPS